MAKLLVAEEDVSVRVLITQVLTCAGYLVTAVGDGEAALAALLPVPQQFTAAVLDQVMFGLRGTEVVRYIRAVHPEFPVLLLSGGGAPVVDQLTRFLPKPFKPDVLVREVAYLTTRERPA